MSDQDNGSSADDLIHQQEFGSRFRIAREAAGFSIYDVSDKLKLTEDIIKALENSQLDVLPASTFTQGYIRSYARLLDLSAEKIINVYTQLLPEKEKPLSARSVLPSQKTSRDSGVKFVTYSVLVISLVLLVIWWYQSEFDWIEDGDKDKAVIEEIKPQQQAFHQTKNVEIKQSEQNENKQPDKVEIKEVIKQVSASDDQDQEAGEDVVINEKINDKDIVLENPEATSVASGEDVLELSATADSWVEVQDVNRKRLYFELIKKDKVQRLHGNAPFRIFLGNAPAVSIQLNNQPVDIAEHFRGNNIAHVALYKDGTSINVRKKKKIKDIEDKNEDESSIDESEPDANE
jgi:cytoskeleton protein RodZ